MIWYRRRRRKRRRKSRYHVGLHRSKKCLNSPMKYRSGWELTTARHLDDDPTVVSYLYEPIKIPYISNKRYGKIRNYIPDFLVTYWPDKKVLIEVKRVSALNQQKVIKKAKAAKLWAKNNNAKFEFWTDPIIKKLQKIQSIKQQKTKTK